MAAKSRKPINQSANVKPGFDVAPGSQVKRASSPRLQSLKTGKRSADQSTKGSQAKSKGTDLRGSIPEAVSQRMVKRMMLFCGLPTFLGLATFPLSYLVVSQGWVELPNVAVLLVSMGGFGLGVLGLSYGALSASWDEEVSGSALGWSEFRTNFGRVLESWRESRS
ncbi:DUF3464 family protein [Synechococcales cyanobacterium C]|uniref:DUF3464 family protein n=1 Tax=Petrachloros mirabilis ULC683 TaxID=2781853 RepID=A0A8K1ZWE3_9CYAN|nr:PAM68 family protein [Petrachloros mirabilis]NCJ05102.1 DUF3464 family protein [Petrachloros mirabilis ULC683]